MNKENLKRECYYIANDIYHQLQMVKYAHVWEIQVCYHFFHWLRKEHLLLEYIENYKHHHIENITGIGLFINRGFTWKNTKQGCVFWMNVDNKWFNYVLNQNKILYKMYGILN